MATLVKETGAGLSNANSYANVADGDAYHDTHLYITAWTGASTANKERALIWATRLLDQHVDWAGYPSNESQALRWPRWSTVDRDGWAIDGDEIPTALTEATCELARHLLSADPTIEPETLGISSVRAGDVGVTFDPKDRESRAVIPESVQVMLTGLGYVPSPTGGWVPVLRV